MTWELYPSASAVLLIAAVIAGLVLIYMGIRR
jgi:hypothetical protein